MFIINDFLNKLLIPLLKMLRIISWHGLDIPKDNIMYEVMKNKNEETEELLRVVKKIGISETHAINLIQHYYTKRYVNAQKKAGTTEPLEVCYDHKLFDCNFIAVSAQQARLSDKLHISEVPGWDDFINLTHHKELDSGYLNRVLKYNFPKRSNYSYMYKNPLEEIKESYQEAGRVKEFEDEVNGRINERLMELSPSVRLLFFIFDSGFYAEDLERAAYEEAVKIVGRDRYELR